MEFFLQIIGGTLYLLNKVFFCIKERSRASPKRWHVLSWTSYLLGLPFIAVLFSLKRDWIVVGVETGGAPAMVMGLIVALRGKGKEPKWLDHIAVVAVIIGIAVSLYDLGGFTKFSQVLEILLTTGFLVGTYRLAKGNSDGYLWFLLMNSSCAALTFSQDLYFLFFQQLASVGFVLDAYRIRRKKRGNEG